MNKIPDGNLSTLSSIAKQGLPSINFASTSVVSSNWQTDDFLQTSSGKGSSKGRANLHTRWLQNSDAIVSILGFTIGLGNIWRFPYLCYRHGGGQFIIPYLLCLMTVGIPVCALEMALGQFSSSGLFRCFDIMPVFRGASITTFTVALLDSIIYNVLISWAIYYFVFSMGKELPWSKCGNWSTPLCETKLAEVDRISCITNPTLTFYPNGTCYNISSNTIYGIVDKNLALSNNITPSMPAKEYLYKEGFMKHDGSQGFLGYLRTDLALCLLAAWLIAYIALIVGLKRSMKFLYFSLIFPLATLVFLFIFSIMQNGSDDGLLHLIRLDTSKFLQIAVWKDALVQVMYSTSVCVGGHIVLSSKNDFHSNFITHAFIVCISDTVVSIFAGIVVFNFIGGFAKAHGVDFDKVINNGMELIFIVYPQACINFPWSSFWSLTFFAMMITLGVDTQIQTMNVIVVTLIEIFPVLYPWKLYVTSCLCASLFFLGLVLTTSGGANIVTAFTDLDLTWTGTIITICYSFIIIIYGPLRFLNDITIMIKPRHAIFHNYCWYYLRWWFIFCLCFICPIAVILCVIQSVYERRKVKGLILYGYNVAFTMQIILVIPVALQIIWSFISTKGTFNERIKTIFSPDPYWGPFLVRHRKLITYVQNWVVNPYGHRDEDPSLDPVGLANINASLLLSIYLRR